VDLFRSWRLDGGHVQKGAKTCPEHLFFRKKKVSVLIHSKCRGGREQREDGFGDDQFCIYVF
jgi:hypothetical protein